MGHKTLEALEAELKNSGAKAYIGRKCVHYKDAKKQYRILDTVIIEATEEVALIYQSGSDPKWVRPFKEFFEEKEVNGQTVKKFTFL